MNPQTSKQPTRRSFHEIVIAGVQAIIGGALAIPAVAYLLGPTKSKKTDTWVETVDVGTLVTKVPVEQAFLQKRVDGWKVVTEKKTAWIVKLSDSANDIVAFGPQCTHLGCAYHYEENKSQFVCPCHTTLFSMDGKVVSGPAPRPLDRFETKIDGTKLMLGELKNSEGKA